MGQRWVVDASNVMGSRPDGWWRDRPAGLHRLLDEIERWRAEVGEEVTVVADGHPTARVPAGRLYGVDVRYARSTRRDAADDVIVEVVGADPDPGTLVVVTSDRRLRSRVVELGSTVEGARRFLDRIADIEPRRTDRAVLARFGIDESALLGRGGEARVFALDGERVLRLPHPGVDPADLEARRRLLDQIRDPAVLATPEVLEQREEDGRGVIVERRLPGRNAMEVLAETGTDRVGLVRDHLDAARRIAQLPCPADAFGELWGPGRITAPTFAAWSAQRLAASLHTAGELVRHLDPARLTADLVDALPDPEPAAPKLVHLDAFLGNMLAAHDRITAVVDFGPMVIGGPAELDPLVAIAYLSPEITPTVAPADVAVARAWAGELGLGEALGPAERWIAAYWTGAVDDERLQRWCRRILLDAPTAARR